jgi:hypothetical protein
VGTITGLDDVEKEKSHLYWDSNSQTSAVPVPAKEYYFLRCVIT